ncbi:MAG TPA: hypothetical protein VKU38_09305 [Ktedonobacteraceae bacterium]|nr:hypothetical protein [Ktedonobacteraceae bacterium]
MPIGMAYCYAHNGDDNVLKLVTKSADWRIAALVPGCAEADPYNVAATPTGIAL